MIKKLHYVWLGGGKLPSNVKACIRSWEKYCPDWEIVQWNETNFDIDHYRWVKEAIEQKQFAFAADFIRLFVLYNFGGAYLDTDVEIIRPIDETITGKFVAGIENHAFGTYRLDSVNEDGTIISTGKIFPAFCLQAGFMYSEPKHPYIRLCMEDLYNDGQKNFVNEDGTSNGFVVDLFMMIELRNKYGVIYRDRTQRLPDDIVIYNSSIFATRKSRNKDSYLIHWFDQSWKSGGLKLKIKRFIKQKMYFLYRTIN